MTRSQNQQYLLSEQYKSASNLNARIALHERFSENNQDFHHWLFDLIQAPSNAKVLELGVGSARMWRVNQARIPTGWQLTLTDLSAGMLSEAQQTLTNANLVATFAQVDAQAIPFETDSFDLVFANHMLYHVPDTRQALQEIRRVLKPAGRLYAATNGKAHMLELNELLLNFAERSGIATEVPDMSGFSLETGAEQLKAVFSNVSWHSREDALVITEAEPLLAYILSMSRLPPDLSQTQPQLIEAFRLELEQMIAQAPLRVRRVTGVYEAW